MKGTIVVEAVPCNEARVIFSSTLRWTGAGIAYTLGAGGLMTGTRARRSQAAAVEFVQISDSHIGFHQAGQSRRLRRR